MATAVWRYTRPSDAKRWFQGAAAERRTGDHLAPLEQLGWVVLHDLSIPKSKANLDHVLVHPSGKFAVYVDTKAWHVATARIRYDNRGRLMYGPWDQTPKMKTVEWEASRLNEETGLPVIPLIACDRGNVIGPVGSPGVININGTYVLRSDALFNEISQMDALNGPDARTADRARKTIERKFPVAQ